MTSLLPPIAFAASRSTATRGGAFSTSGAAGDLGVRNGGRHAAPTSNNQQRLYLQRNADSLRDVQRRNAEAEVRGPRFAPVAVPRRPEPHPHMYGGPDEAPLPLLGPRSALLVMHLGKLRAIDATEGPNAVAGPELARRVDALKRGAAPPP